MAARGVFGSCSSPRCRTVASCASRPFGTSSICSSSSGSSPPTRLSRTLVIREPTDETVLRRVERGRGTTRDPGLLIEVTHVLLDRAGRNEQSPPNFLVRSATREVDEHFHLALGEPARADGARDCVLLTEHFGQPAESFTVEPTCVRVSAQLRECVALGARLAPRSRLNLRMKCVAHGENARRHVERVAPLRARV